MIAETKLITFLAKAGELWAADGQQIPRVPADPPGSLSSDRVFAQLEWRPEDKRYFQDNADNLLRELEYQGLVVIWDEDQPASIPTDPAWIIYTFTLTDKGLGQARHR